MGSSLPDGVLIRPAKVDDVEVVAQFNCALCKETETFELNWETIVKGVTAVLSGKTAGRYYVLEKDGKVVAQLMITFEWSDWRNSNLWWIQSVYVLPDCRKNGYFKALYNYVKEQGAQEGACGLRLYVELTNDKAQQTYIKMGMTSHYKVYEDMFTSF